MKKYFLNKIDLLYVIQVFKCTMSVYVRLTHLYEQANTNLFLCFQIVNLK